MKRNVWLVTCIAALGALPAVAAEDDEQITPCSLRVQPLTESGSVSWITLKGYRETGSPAFSPDGEWIAFDAYQRGYFDSDAEVWLARRDGTDAELISEGDCPGWSPDGEKLACCQYDKALGAPMIRIVTLKSDEHKFIGYGWYRANWSADGKSVVANGYRYGNDRAMVRLSVEKPSKPEVLFPELGRILSPCCSRDGKYMVFVADRPATESDK